MQDDSRILELLQQAIGSGTTPETVCRHAQELLPEVRRRWEGYRRVEAELQALFPAHLGISTQSDQLVVDANLLPIVPGYEVMSILGRGGVGVVYRARHLGLQRVVALKMLLSGPYAGPAERARFLREARSIAALRHPHVVQVHDVGEYEGRPYFTMELVAGGSLAEALGGVPQPAAQAAATAADLADAIDAAHQQRIVHRDLKPANVLLDNDGIAKVTDFGLAFIADQAGDVDRLTLSGARLGTPSYMAPEQAAGRHSSVGPQTDVYALGAILYEMLTGRPPFRGESVAETERQVIAEDPAAPSKLNARVPRDLETVCLKCLSKNPQHRYTSAAALAEDLRRFLRNEPVTARRAGRVELATRWARRKPAAAIAIAAVLFVTLLLAGAGAWLAADRAAAVRAITIELAEAEQAQQRSDWTAALRTLDRVALRLSKLGGAVSLRERYDRARQNQGVADSLEAVRLNVAPLHLGLSSAINETSRTYASVFRAAGTGNLHDDPQIVAKRIEGSNIRAALVAALDHWHLSAGEDPSVQQWVQDVLLHLDPSPSAWRREVRSPGAVTDQATRARLVDTAPFDGESLPLLLAFGQALAFGSAEESVPFMTRLQQKYPADFWSNLFLCEALCRRRNEGDPVEAVRYAQAAIAIRPTSAAAHYYLGMSLRWSNRVGEATAAFRTALECDPDLLQARHALAKELFAAGLYTEAYQVCDAPFRRLHPDRPDVAMTLGDIHAAVDRPDTAAKHYRHALTLQPGLYAARRKLQNVLIRDGRTSEALTPEALRWWRSWLEEDRPATEWEGFAELAAYLGLRDEYRWACRRQVDQFDRSTDPTVLEGVGRACLLMPLPPDDLRRATSMIDRAVAGERAKATWRKPYYSLAKALAEYRAGRPKAALDLISTVPETTLMPLPMLVKSLAYSALGDRTAAMSALASAGVSADWVPELADRREVWMFEVLRREATVAAIPEMEAIIAGKQKPRNSLERAAAATSCAATGRQGARATWWAELMATDPTLRRGRGREMAAAAAVAAGYGFAIDVTSVAERSRWREQALRLVREELDAADATLAEGDAGRARLQLTLDNWTRCHDMKPVREGYRLSRLPNSERTKWIEIWREVSEMRSRLAQKK